MRMMAMADVVRAAIDQTSAIQRWDQQVGGLFEHFLKRLVLAPIAKVLEVA